MVVPAATAMALPRDKITAPEDDARRMLTMPNANATVRAPAPTIASARCCESDSITVVLNPHLGVARSAVVAGERSRKLLST